MSLRQRAAASPLLYGVVAGSLGVVAALILVLLLGHLWMDHLFIDGIRQERVQQVEQAIQRFQQQQGVSGPPASAPAPVPASAAPAAAKKE